MIPSGGLASLELLTSPRAWGRGREGRVRPWIVWIIALTWSLAVASPLAMPTNADVFLTTERGTIVGVGRISEGRAFEIRILQGFSGPARLTLVAPGDVSVVDVVVRGRDLQLPDGDLLLLDGTSVLASLRMGGVVITVVWSEASAAGDRAPGILGANASERGLEQSNPRADEGGNPNPGEPNPRAGEDNPGRRP
jgi:hypothetical protein